MKILMNKKTFVARWGRVPFLRVPVMLGIPIRFKRRIKRDEIETVGVPEATIAIIEKGCPGLLVTRRCT